MGSSKLLSMSVLVYFLFLLDLNALVCQVNNIKLFWSLVVVVALAWSSWAAYPFLSMAVPSSRKALVVYLVLLLYLTIFCLGKRLEGH
jgi:hypothetical protein